MCKQLKPSTCETTCKRSLVHMLQWLWLSQLFWPTTPAFFHEKNLKRRKVAPSISRSQFAWIHSHNRGQLRHGRFFSWRGFLEFSSTYVLMGHGGLFSRLIHALSLDLWESKIDRWCLCAYQIQNKWIFPERSNISHLKVFDLYNDLPISKSLEFFFIAEFQFQIRVMTYVESSYYWEHIWSDE